MRYLSICSGIEAATEAWEPLGWEAVGYSEIEPFPCAYLAHRYGASGPLHMPEPDEGLVARIAALRAGGKKVDEIRKDKELAGVLDLLAARRLNAELPGAGRVPNFGDMEQWGSWPDLEVDVLCGGTPCQAFSVAGLRGGLEDARGNLTVVFTRIAARYRPKIIVWENVPGVLNHATNPFGCFVSALCGFDRALVSPFRGGGGEDSSRWPRAGLVRGPGRAVAWCVLDAQYFGVPQRRERVWLVAVDPAAFADPGSAPDPAEILALAEGLSGDPAPCRETGAGVARCLTASTGGCSGKGQQHTFVGGSGEPLNALGEDTFVSTGVGWRAQESANKADTLVVADVANALTTDVSCDRVGEEANLVICEDVAGTLCADTHPGSYTGQDAYHGMLVVCAAGEVSHALRGEGFDGSEDGTGRGTLVVAVHGSQDPIVSEEIGHPVGRNSGLENCIVEGDEPYTLAIRGRGEDGCRLEARQDGVANALLTPTGGRSGIGVGAIGSVQHGVRRLTPMECERLQGFRDEITRIPYGGKAAEDCPDGPRYKAIGNSWPVPVAAWIGERIEECMKMGGVS